MYVITSTSGIGNDESSYVLSAEGIKRREVEPSSLSADGPAPALFRSREAAEAAVRRITARHSKSSPQVYAGLNVSAAPALHETYSELCCIIHADGLSDDDIIALAGDREDDMYEQEGEAAYGRPD